MLLKGGDHLCSISAETPPIAFTEQIIIHERNEMNNKYEIQFAKRMKENYPPGTRLELISMDDPYAKIPPGTRGTVVCVDDIGTIHVNWDNGSGLGLVPGEDAFRRLSPAEIEDETNTVEDKGFGMSM